MLDAGRVSWCNGPVTSNGPRRRPLNEGYVLKILGQFTEALKWDRIPHQVFRAVAPDMENDRIVIIIYPDDEYFRRNVAELLPQASFVIKVEPRSAVAL